MWATTGTQDPEFKAIAGAKRKEGIEAIKILIATKHDVLALKTESQAPLQFYQKLLLLRTTFYVMIAVWQPKFEQQSG